MIVGCTGSNCPRHPVGTGLNTVADPVATHCNKEAVPKADACPAVGGSGKTNNLSDTVGRRHHAIPGAAGHGYKDPITKGYGRLALIASLWPACPFESIEGGHHPARSGVGHSHEEAVAPGHRSPGHIARILARCSRDAHQSRSLHGRLHRKKRPQTSHSHTPRQSRCCPQHSFGGSRRWWQPRLETSSGSDSADAKAAAD